MHTCVCKLIWADLCFSYVLALQGRWVMPPSGVPFTQSEAVKRKLASEAREDLKIQKKIDKLEAAMGPKKTAPVDKAAPNKRAKGPQAAPVAVEDMTPEEKRLAQANMVTQLKTSSKTSQDCKATLQLYNSLGRMDKEKTVLLQKWLLGKNCEWYSEYSSKRVLVQGTESQKRLAYGTEPGA